MAVQLLWWPDKTFAGEGVAKMGRIRMDYSEVMTEANRVAQLADAGDRYIRDMRTARTQLPAVWNGQSGDAFMQVCTGWERDMRDLVHLLNDISSNLRTVAREIREAEERARRAANTTF